jgi:hypothetical protein
MQLHALQGVCRRPWLQLGLPPGAPADVGSDKNAFVHTKVVLEREDS